MITATHDNEHKRVKHGEMPGQRPRRTIIRMIETKFDHQNNYDLRGCGWFKVLRHKAKKVQRRRNHREIERQLDETLA